VKSNKIRRIHGMDVKIEKTTKEKPLRGRKTPEGFKPFRG
jgi:hypothetical protein